MLYIAWISLQALERAFHYLLKPGLRVPQSCLLPITSCLLPITISTQLGLRALWDLKVTSNTLISCSKRSYYWQISTIDISPSAEEAQVILEPKPSSDPNDPLVSQSTPALPLQILISFYFQNWLQWRKYVNFGFVSYYAMMVFALWVLPTPFALAYKYDLEIEYWFF
jgi:hypothetical protein